MREEIYFKYGNEEINALEVLEEIAKIGFNDYYYEKQCKAVEIAVNYIDKLQKELDQLKEVDRQICCEELITKEKYQDILKENANYKKLILNIKGKLNNIQFEVEQSWRKIEKLESKYE